MRIQAVWKNSIQISARSVINWWKLKIATMEHLWIEHERETHTFVCAWSWCGLVHVRNPQASNTQRTNIVDVFFYFFVQMRYAVDNEQQLKSILQFAEPPHRQHRMNAHISPSNLLYDGKYTHTHTNGERVNERVFLLLLLLLLWRFKINSVFSFDSHHRLMRLVEMLVLYWTTANKPSTVELASWSTVYEASNRKPNKSKVATDAQTVQSMCFGCLCWITLEGIIIIISRQTVLVLLLLPSSHNCRGKNLQAVGEFECFDFCNAVADTMECRKSTWQRVACMQNHCYFMHYLLSRQISWKICFPSKYL